MSEDVSRSEALSIWTIYDHPNDFPDCFVARRFVGEEPTAEVMCCTDVGEIRMVLEGLGLTMFPRDEEDDPVIVESWL